MRLLHHTLSFAPGGRRRAITSLMEGLRDFEVISHLCCLESLGCAPGELESFVDDLEALERRSPWQFRPYRKILDFCDRNAIQVIHAHDAAAQLSGAVIRLWRPHIRLLMTFHRSLGFESARWRDRIRNALAGTLCGAIVTGSRERRNHFLRENCVSPDKVVRIPFGVNVKLFREDRESRACMRRQLGLNDSTVILGAVGHFRPEKGMENVLAAFARLVKRPAGRSAILVMLGDHPAEGRRILQEISNQLPAGRVLFPGYRENIENWFQLFDVFVHSPRLEAFGLVVTEAMATGLPVVATKVGGIPDLVEDGKNGILLAEPDPEKTADALEQLIIDRDLRIRMGERSREIAVTAFSSELYVRRHLQLYQDLLAGRKPRGLENDPAPQGQESLDPLGSQEPEAASLSTLSKTIRATP